jgi:hypothetical protein
LTAGVLDAEEVDDFPAFDELEPETTPKRTRKPRDPNAAPRTRTTSDAKLAQELLEPMAMLGQAVSFMSPTAGAVVIARGEATTTALVKFAKGHPKMLAALRSASKASPIAELAQTVAMIVIAFQLDLGAIQPTAPIAVLSGVSNIFSEMQEYTTPAGVMDNPPTVGGNFENISPPPLYHAEGYNDDGTWESPPGFRAGPGAGIRNP